MINEGRQGLALHLSGLVMRPFARAVPAIQIKSLASIVLSNCSGIG